MIPPRPTDDRLYRLLPAIYRIRDVAQGEPLRALLAIIEQELQVVEADIDTLYDNCFIETCDNWVVPYIGDLLDVDELDSGNSIIAPDAESTGQGAYGLQERRAYVANTLAYRRRKGTMPVLEQLTQDVTGWRSRAVEFGRLVNTTQNLDRNLPHSLTVDIRANTNLEQVGTPFETQAAYSVEVRPMQQGGRYNVPNIGLYIWRLQSYPLTRVQARVLDSGHYTFHPAGPEQVPLFNQPQTKTITALASEINVPAVLRRPVLADELAGRRHTRYQGQHQTGNLTYFDTDPVLEIYLNGQPRALPPESILITDLGTDATSVASAYGLNEPLEWQPGNKIPWDGRDPQNPLLPPAYLVAVDPERGQMMMRPGLCPRRVEVSYFSGFSGDVGGGAYSRLATLSPKLKPSHLPISPWHWQVKQTDSASPNPLAIAMDAWNRMVVARYGLRMQTHIPLALITIQPVQVAKVRKSESEALPKFKPGWVQGLQVSRGVCPNEVVIRPGLAVDREGHLLELSGTWCLDVSTRFKDSILQQRDRPSLLVLYFKPTEQGNPIALGLVDEAILAGYSPGSVIPLAKLHFDEAGQLQNISQIVEDDFPQLQPGILQGFEVYTRPNTLETLIKPGIVVDQDGNVLVLVEPHPVALEEYQGSEPRLIAVPSMSPGQQIQLVSEAELDALQLPYILLGQLSVPQVTLANVVIQPDQIGRAPDIKIEGLSLRRVGQEIEIAAGTMQLSTDRRLCLKAPHRINLSAYAGRTLLLFLSDQPDQGLPLDFTLLPENEEAVYLGIVPVEPSAQSGDPLGLDQVDTGYIVVQDSGTYQGDMAIAVPPHSRLQIVAANGCRPHLQGHITLQGWQTPQQARGELSLNGLLVEGGVQVLPGSLGRLSLHHCTLVPQAGGICVDAQHESGISCDDRTFSLLAFVTYCLITLWRLIGQELGMKTKAPSMTMTQFLQTSWEQLLAGIVEVLMPHSQTAQSQLWGNISLAETKNNRLEIDLYRTLSGPLYLADTVPSLRIEGSAVDKGQLTRSSAVAIQAPGTTVDIRTTTILGRTTARQIEASDCLFTEKVTVLRHQEGCIRFSYVPVASRTPRRYQCQPDIALQAALGNIPGGVTALDFIPNSEDNKGYRVLLATARDGIFKFQQPSPDSTEPAAIEPDSVGENAAEGGATGEDTLAEQTSTLNQWQEINGDLPNRNLSVIAAYTWPIQTAATAVNSPQTTSQDVVLQQKELMLGTPTGEIFRLVRGLYAPTTESEPNWRVVSFSALNAAITQLYPDQIEGSGTVVIHRQETLLEERSLARITGQGTRFSHELQVEDVIVVEGQSWQVEQIGRSSGNSRLTLDRRTAKVSGAVSNTLSVGDTLTLNRLNQHQRWPQKISQTRKIVRLISTAAQGLTIRLDTPFGPEIEQGTPLPFTININTELSVKSVSPQGLTQTPPQGETATGEATATESELAESDTVPFQILHLWATTDGRGIWRGAITGQTWQPLNTGLTNYSVTTVVRDSQRHLWVGTLRSGVFLLTLADAGDRWVAENEGLTTRQVNALYTMKNGTLLAATDVGVFRFEHGNAWSELGEGLSDYDITAVTATNQHIFAGSRDGKVFRAEVFSSSDRELTWQPIALDLQGTDITALVVEPESGDVWVGSAAGEVFRLMGSYSQSADFELLAKAPDQPWKSIRAGRTTLATKLQILSQVQPSFTSICWGEPGYLQLRETIPASIRTGAENGSEMGIFNYLRQPQREKNLLTSFDEYLRFGLSAGIFYMT